ncbi:sodium-dependent phosphate transport protein 2B-like isoform X1 [Penaeus chinensis]|uniref:sodium-dependent phosphate transport protein 2B-like isoform X1 n=2 Tax=Penaeus chinensis TaxID=139456 RepID=UPI001FB7EC0A|nr:sodium-dependent phosphate transport protein 2B-like isoform X1 [Penaeus chinensis]
MVAFNQDPPPYDGQMDNGHVNTAYNGDAPTKAADKEREVQERSKAKENDPWAIVELVEDSGPKWSDMSTSDKVKRVLLNTAKVCTALGLLYMFICSLDFLSASFRLIAGKTTGDVLNNEYVKNPIVGLMIGILVTVLVQSSSTSTSIIVSMVSAGILNVHEAVPMIMGSNIGTSVTNTIVSLTQVGDRNEFRRAFAGATVHDMFNWLTVFTLLTIEIATGLLETMTTAMVADLGWASGGGEVKLLKYLTEPFTKIVIQLDKEVLNAWGTGQGELANETSLIKRYCKKECIEASTTAPLLLTQTGASECEKVGVPHSCHFLFYETSLTDSQVGIILLISSLLILCTALVFIVKILNSMMKGKMAMIIKKTINADIPYVPWLTGYIAILVGAVMTFLVQSSSIFTSTLTPLIGIGVISVERSYPLTLGSNIGTTTTALLAAMAGEGQGLVSAIQIALVHLFFNIFGILLFYPIPFMRFPIPLSKKLGDTTAKYRWFAIMYLVVMFFFLPGFIFLLSLGGKYALYFVGLPLLILFVLVVILNVMQSKCPQILPNVLKNWNWLPKPLHSLSPYDKCCLALPCCKSCRDATEESNELEKVEVEKTTGIENQAYDSNDTRF